MDYQKLTVGQMAELNGVSCQTLRHYDREGLLKPAVVDGNTGYRYYKIMQNARLDMIQYLKSMGISLRAIKTYIDSGDTDQIVMLLNDKRADIDASIDTLQQQKRAIRRMVESIQRYETAPPDGTIVMEYIGARSIFCHETGQNFYEGGIETYERMLRSLKEQIHGRNLPEIYFYNAGTVLRRENLLKRHFYSSEVFVLVDRDMAGPAQLTPLPPSTYYCIYCNRFDREQDYALRLIERVEREGLQITGDYLCEVLYEPPVASTAQRDMLMRLQVPISFR